MKVLSSSLRSRRLEVVGTRKNGHATSKRLLRRLRVFYQVTLATYYQVNQSRRNTSYPGWLVVDYHVVELRQQIL